MAGLVHLAFGPTNFFVGFIISETIGWLSSIGKEGLHMAKKVIREISTYANCTMGRIIASWEAHLPSGVNPLTSL